MTTKKLTIGETEYLVEMKPGRYLATITEIGWIELGGRVARAFEEMTGKPMLTRIEYIVDRDRYPEIVKSAGWKFSKRAIWKNTYEYYARGK